jgi:hypothetical protein
MSVVGGRDGFFSEKNEKIPLLATNMQAEAASKRGSDGKTA